MASEADAGDMLVLNSRAASAVNPSHGQMQNKSHDLTYFYIALIVLTTLSVLVRLFSRKASKLHLSSDDWTFLVGAALAIASFAVLMVYTIKAGLGQHWSHLSFVQKALFRKLNYIYNILNVISFPTIKISILLLYLRIFSLSRVRFFCWLGVALIGSIGVASALTSILACWPIASFYDITVQGTCIDFVRFYYAAAVINVATDIYILILPLPALWPLQMTLERKIVGIVVLSLGSVTFVIGILRIVYYHKYTSDDPSFSFWQTAFATPAEVCLAVIVTTIPMLRAALGPIIRKVRSKAHWSTLGIKFGSWKSSSPAIELDGLPANTSRPHAATRVGTTRQAGADHTHAAQDRNHRKHHHRWVQSASSLVISRPRSSGDDELLPKAVFDPQRS